jgi:prevent-host-death family protein
MRHVGSYEAKTHLAHLLEEVERGEVIVITRHGHPIARLVPANPERAPAADVVAAFRRARAGVTLGMDLSLEDLIAEGRR